MNQFDKSLQKFRARKVGNPIEKCPKSFESSSGGSPPPLDDARFRGDTACLGIFIKALIDITEI